MLRDEQLRIIKELRDHLKGDSTAYAKGMMRAPVDTFTCTDLLQKELDQFFKKEALLLGLSPDLPENNTYIATSETGVPILMTRDSDGRFRAFLNVCRHRGVQVIADGRGRKANFSCPFHSWTYRNTGDLISVTKEERFGCIDKGDHGLVALPAEEKYGMLWVRPTPDGHPINVDAAMGGLGIEIENWDIASHPYVEEQTLEANINWKLAIDTFGENYHFDFLHKGTLAPQIYGNLQTSQAFDNNYRMVFASKTNFDQIVEHMPEEEWPYRYMTLNVYFIYPNTIFLVDAIGLDLLRMYPDPKDPGKSKTHHRYYANPEMVNYLEKQREETGENHEPESRFVGFNEIVVDEDYAMAELTQLGASSGAQTHYWFGRNEPALQHYHNVHRKGVGLPELEVIES